MTVIRFAPRAQADVEEAEQWWIENRPVSPGLFARELEQTLGLLRHTPTLGVRYRNVGDRLVRRVLLRHSRAHIYYWFDEPADRVEILAVWGAPKERDPWTERQ